MGRLGVAGDFDIPTAQIQLGARKEHCKIGVKMLLAQNPDRRPCVEKAAAAIEPVGLVLRSMANGFHRRPSHIPALGFLKQGFGQIIGVLKGFESKSVVDSPADMQPWCALALARIKPRFEPRNRVADAEKVEKGEGSRINSYLQLKTVNTDVLKGKILIDSPGFDADSQRDSTLRITNHIIDMSDLVLVFFDGRHPEPGAMRDTLEHLVSTTLKRKDSAKILYILNQIDTAAKEDNPEEIISAWQRAISSQGLVGGNFYSIYNEESANPFENSEQEERFKRKKDIDLSRIYSRIDKVSIERTYRITGAIENIVDEIHTQKIPLIENAIRAWRKKVIGTEIVVFSALIVIIFYALLFFGAFNTPISDWTIVLFMQQSLYHGAGMTAAGLFFILSIHGYIRSNFAEWDAKRIEKNDTQLANALRHNTRFWRGMFSTKPRGWTSRNRKKLTHIVNASKSAIQKLNDQFANPSGKTDKSEDHRNASDLNNTFTQEPAELNNPK